MQAFTQLIKNKTKLKSLLINFNDCIDHDGKVLKLVTGVSMECKISHCSIDCCEITQLKEVSIVHAALEVVKCH